MESIFNSDFHTEIIENRVALKNLDPFNKLLDYLIICQLGEEEGTMIHFSQEPKLKKEFSERFGNSVMPLVLREYNEALVKEIGYRSK